MQTTRNRFGPVIFALTLSLTVAGCAGTPTQTGDSPGEVAPPAQQGEQQEEVVTFDVPEHLPIEIAPGGQVNGLFEPVAGTAQDHWVLRVTYPEGDAAEVVAFYDQQLEGLGILDQKLEGGNSTRWTTTDTQIVTMTLKTGSLYYPGSAVFEVGWSA